MRNIFLFIRRYRTFLSFLFLQMVALYFLFTYNRFHRVKFLGVSNEVTGRINTQYNKVEDYFTLREENKRVHRMNDSLLNLLPRNFVRKDTAAQIIQDSVAHDTTGMYRRYFSRPATVVYSTVNAQKNYIQINRGSNQGVKDNMAVVGSDGSVVGVVISTSPNFSQVMSLLHVQHRVNASLKNSNISGTVDWDGSNAQHLSLRGIPQDVKVGKGDTVLTSNYSFNFPPGYMIGTIDAIVKDKSTNFYVLRVKTAANFFNIQQVHVIENLDRTEQAKLMEETKKKMEQSKKPIK
jgi:rod shape-determining protein MreC